jgi:hypothetical protein
MHPHGALVAAAASGNAATLRQLLGELDAAPTEPSLWRRVVTCLRGYFDHPPDASTEVCTAALAAACRSGHVDVVRMLLAHGRAEPDMRQATGCERRPAAAAVVAALLQDGRADPNDGLWAAAASGNLQVVDLLLCDPRTVELSSALAAAVLGRHTHIACAVAVHPHAAQVLPVMLHAMRSSLAFPQSLLANDMEPCGPGEFAHRVAQAREQRARMIVTLEGHARMLRRRVLLRAVAGP